MSRREVPHPATAGFGNKAARDGAKASRTTNTKGTKASKMKLQNNFGEGAESAREAHALP
ncbi:MAG: hypothetical protein QOI22_1614 [Verrucomicrobiota bacterium]